MKHAVVRLLVAFCVAALVASPVNAQATKRPSPETLQRLQSLADQVKAALQQGDIEKANRLASDLMTATFEAKKALEPTPKEKLEALEQAQATGGLPGAYGLKQLAMAAFDASELDKADRYARELLSLAAQNSKDGTATFYGNLVVGRVALRRNNDVAVAKSSLLAAGQTPGSPALNSFGPNMSLAKDLLAQGERDTVLQFFDECRKFWKMAGSKLDDWTALVKDNRIPNFGANLVY